MLAESAAAVVVVVVAEMADAEFATVVAWVQRVRARASSWAIHW